MCTAAQTLCRLQACAPLELWPERERRLLRARGRLRHLERFTFSVFLYGNGASPQDVQALLAHRLRDASARRHVAETLALCGQAASASRLYYYDVRLQDERYLNGALREKVPNSRQLVRAINLWDEFCQQHWKQHSAYPALHAQSRFFGMGAVDQVLFVRAGGCAA